MSSEVVMVWDYWYQPIEPRFIDFLLGKKTEQGRRVHVRMRDSHFPRTCMQEIVFNELGK